MVVARVDPSLGRHPRVVLHTWSTREGGEALKKSEKVESDVSFRSAPSIAKLRAEDMRGSSKQERGKTR